MDLLQKESSLCTEILDPTIIEQYQNLGKEISLIDYNKEYFYFIRSQIAELSNVGYKKCLYQSIIYEIPEVEEILKGYDINSKEELSEMLEFHNLSKTQVSALWKEICKNDCVSTWFSKKDNILFLDDFFEYEKNIQKYQKLYTLYLYYKVSLIEFIKRNPNCQSYIKQLRSDIEINLYYIEKCYKDIVSVILEERQKYSSASCVIDNGGLIKILNKKEGSTFTSKQEMLLKALAFGLSREEINAKKFDKAKRLVYSK